MGWLDGLRQPQLRTKLNGSKMNNKLIGAFDVIVVNYSVGSEVWWPSSCTMGF